MRKTLNVLAVAVFLLTGCGHSDSMTAEPSMTLRRTDARGDAGDGAAGESSSGADR